MLYGYDFMLAEYLSHLNPAVGGSFEPRHANDDQAASGPRETAGPNSAAAVVAFWREAGPSLWFPKNADFDRRFRDRFIALYEIAARGSLVSWRSSAQTALALVLLLDQFPRNAFRGSARMYATDGAARTEAVAAIAARHDYAVEPELRLFFYLPFAHSEVIADQDRCVVLCRELGREALAHAEHHRHIVHRFGRFPHRNAILGRATTLDEQAFLDAGGFAG